MRGIRQGCPASGYMCTMAFDPVFRRLETDVLPPEPHRPWFVQRSACACADDLALDTASLLESLPVVADAFVTIDQVTGMSLNYQKCHWIQYGTLTRRQQSEWVGSHVPVFRRMQIEDHAKYLVVVIGPDADALRWMKARNKFIEACARIRASSQSMVQRFVSFNVYALSILSITGSVDEPDKETIVADMFSLQRPSAGAFHALPSAMLRRGVPAV